jgi:hypothetical protein
MFSDTTPVSSPQPPSCDEPGQKVTPSAHPALYQAGIADAYFEINEPEPSRTGRSRLLRLAAFGLGGAAAAAGIYYAFPGVPGYEIGLAAAGAGWLAGRLAEPVAGGLRTSVSDQGS